MCIRDRYGTYDGNAVTEGRQHSRSGEMDAAPVIRENRTYLPIRYVAEQFGYDVLWDGASRTVRLVSELPVDWTRRPRAHRLRTARRHRGWASCV